MVPVPPTGGDVIVQAAGPVIETKVVFAETVSVSVTTVAGLGPLLVTVIV